MKPLRPLVPLFLLLAAAACAKRMIPRPDPGWMPLGGSDHSIALLDTTSVRPDGNARLVRIRIDSIMTNADGDPVVIPSARRESVHRVRCADLQVQDLSPTPPRGVPSPDAAIAGSAIAFDRHPLGDELFPTVCRTLGTVATIRAAEKEKEAEK